MLTLSTSGEFRGTDFPGESILAMSCDSESTTLVTADTQGFIYTWDIEEFCMKPECEVGLTVHKIDSKNRTSRVMNRQLQEAP